jgi:membrane associated rhomboid family serine protease
MTDAPGAEACYRHPSRTSWTLCQRCGRTICGQCQTQAPVGVQCPECVREGRVSSISAHREQRRLSYGGPVKRTLTRWLGLPAPVTTAIVAVTAAVGLVQLFTGGLLQQWLGFYAPVAVVQPWRFVTAALVHASILHFLFNMLVLYMVGPNIERRIGALPYLAVYLVTAAAGSIAVSFLSPGTLVVGASGAIFGLFGIYIGLQRMLGGRFDPQILIIVGLNLVIGFVLAGVSWQAHVGGLLAGLALGFWMGSNLRGRETRRATWLPIGVVAGAVLLACLVVVVAL